MEQMTQVSYCASSFFTNRSVEEAAKMLVDSTGGQMTRAYIVNSGLSTLMDARQEERVTDQ